MKIKFIYILLCLAATFSSCNKWLDVDLANIVDESDLFSTSDGFDEALAGVYSQMSKSDMYGGRFTMEYIDLYAQYYSIQSTASTYTEHLSYTYTDESVELLHSYMWSSLYSAISGANNIVKWADTNTDVLTEEKRNQIKGEAIGLRAFLHFDLIRMFCIDVKLSPETMGIPYNKTFGVSLPAQYTIEECVQLVLNDLSEAEELLADDEITTLNPYELSDKDDADLYVARMNIYAVKALKARLYLMKGDMVNAAKYAKEIIECGHFQLLDFSDVDQSESETDMLFSDEHIFSLRNIDIPDITEALFESVTEGSVTSLAPLSFNDYSSLYETNNDDVRYVKWFNVTSSGGFIKYTTDNTDKFYPKMPIIKLSEMYLIYAEAVYYTNPDETLTYLNELRDHRIRNNVHWQYITMDYIFEEYKREFVAEGQLWYAYKRLNKNIPTTSVDGDVVASNSVFVFPMPTDEVEIGGRE